MDVTLPSEGVADHDRRDEDLAGAAGSGDDTLLLQQ
jgi:hypothetical protein